MPSLDPRMHVASAMQGIKGLATKTNRVKARSLTPSLSGCVGMFQVSEVNALVQKEGEGKVSIADYKKEINAIVAQAKDWCKKLSDVVENNMAKNEAWAGIMVNVRKAVADCKVSIASEAKKLLQ